MPSEWILAIDQGTTNTKALLMDREGDSVYRTSAALEILQPRRDWVEAEAVLRAMPDRCRQTSAPLQRT